MRSIQLVIILLFFACFINEASSQSVYINEFMSSNYLFLLDEDGDDSDWIEVYNSSSSAINLNNYYLSDDDDELEKWNFPDIEIESHSFLLVFASGKDRRDPNAELHANFSIKADGEELLLSKDGEIIHFFDDILLTQNQSYGLLPDGGINEIIFDLASPGMPNEYVEIEKVFFSQRGGIYDTCFSISITNVKPENKIYYTIDASTPDTNSIEYNGQLFLDKSLCSPIDIYKVQITIEEDFYIPDETFPKAIVIRAASFNSNGVMQSKIETHTYFIKDLDINHYDLPIIAISADTTDLFNYNKGILVPGKHWDEDDPEWTGNYYQTGIEWEKVVSVECYEADNKALFMQTLGLRTHGGNVRRMTQKGLKVYARSEYGKNSISCNVFKDNDLDKYYRLVLKPFSSSWSDAGVEDYISNNIAKQINLDNPSSRPMVLYVNAEYWGVYFLQERVDKYFFSSHYDIDSDSLDVIGNWNGDVVDGSANDFYKLYEFVENNDFKINENYSYVSNLIDIDNFIDYQLFEIFIANSDWPANNNRLWKSQKIGAKWRWVFFDGDAGLQDVDFDGFENAMNTSNDYWPTNAESTLFLRKFLENLSFRNMFLSRLEKLLNNELSYSNTYVFNDECYTFLDDEINNQISRFNSQQNISNWVEDNINIDNFLAYRPCEMQKQYKKLFGYELNVPDCEKPSVEVSIFQVYPNPNNGTFKLKINANRSGPVVVMLTNVLGQQTIIYNEIIIAGTDELYFENIDVAGGMYMISIVFKDEFFTAKIFIQK